MTAKRPGLQWSDGAAGPFLAALDSAGASTAWQEYAACAETDPEAFFVEKGGSTRPAKQVCAGCFAQQQCLEYAMEHEIRFGVWGGLSDRERQRLKRQRARQQELAQAS